MYKGYIDALSEHIDKSMDFKGAVQPVQATRLSESRLEPISTESLRPTTDEDVQRRISEECRHLSSTTMLAYCLFWLDDCKTCFGFDIFSAAELCRAALGGFLSSLPISKVEQGSSLLTTLPRTATIHIVMAQNCHNIYSYGPELPQYT